MPRMIFLASLMLYAVAALARVDDTAAYGPPRAATSAEIDALRSAMSMDLKDSESARFANVLVRSKLENARTSRICGSVNSKNSYGGYAGFSKFTAATISPPAGMADPGPIAIVVDPKIAAAVCAPFGM